MSETHKSLWVSGCVHASTSTKWAWLRWVLWSSQQAFSCSIVPYASLLKQQIGRDKTISCKKRRPFTKIDIYFSGDSLCMTVYFKEDFYPTMSGYLNTCLVTKRWKLLTVGWWVTVNFGPCYQLWSKCKQRKPCRHLECREEPRDGPGLPNYHCTHPLPAVVWCHAHWRLNDTERFDGGLNMCSAKIMALKIRKHVKLSELRTVL